MSRGIFWALTLQPGKLYSPSKPENIRITVAALEARGKPPRMKKVSLFVVKNGMKFLVCTLEYNKTMQTQLDLKFSSDDHFQLYVSGDGTIHLTGYHTTAEEKEKRKEIAEDKEDSESSLRRFILSVQERQDDVDYGAEEDFKTPHLTGYHTIAEEKENSDSSLRRFILSVQERQDDVDYGVEEDFKTKTSLDSSELANRPDKISGIEKELTEQAIEPSKKPYKRTLQQLQQTSTNQDMVVQPKHFKLAKPEKEKTGFEWWDEL